MSIYLEKIRKSEDKINSIQEKINKNKESLTDYYKEVELLKEKYNFKEIDSKLFDLNTEIKEENERLISAKILIICEYINKLINHKYFKNEDNVFGMLRCTFAIKRFDDFYNYDAFFEVVKEIFEYNENISELVYNDDFPDIFDNVYKIGHTKYFRNEVDGQFTLEIPKEIVNNLDDFINKVDELLSKYDDCVNEAKKKDEELAKENRRKMYEKLKKEFGNES